MSNPFRDSLSYANVFMHAIRVEDWRELYGENCDGWRIVLPPVTRGVLEEYGAEDFYLEIAPAEFNAEKWMEANLPEDFESEDERQAALREAREEFEEDDESALAQAIERFERTDSFYDWQQRFEPAMNFYWPVNLAYGVSEEDAAALIDRHAGATSLVYIESFDTHAIVLTGGGMDLSWDICAAYVCCGCVPPMELLEGLPEFKQHGTDMLRFILETCVPKAAEFVEGRAARMREHAARIAPKVLSED